MSLFATLALLALALFATVTAPAGPAAMVSVILLACAAAFVAHELLDRYLP